MALQIKSTPYPYTLPNLRKLNRNPEYVPRYEMPEATLTTSMNLYTRTHHSATLFTLSYIMPGDRDSLTLLREWDLCVVYERSRGGYANWDLAARRIDEHDLKRVIRMYERDKRPYAIYRRVL